MTILKINKVGQDSNIPKISELEYETFVTGVPNGKDCIYIKVKKKPLTKKEYESCTATVSTKLVIQWEVGHSVLLNISYGTLRQIPGETRVIPLKPELYVSELLPECFEQIQKKRRYKKNKICKYPK